MTILSETPGGSLASGACGGEDFREDERGELAAEEADGRGQMRKEE